MRWKHRDDPTDHSEICSPFFHGKRKLNWKTLIPFFSLAVLLSAGLTVLGYSLRPPRRTLIYICKPLTMVLVFAVAALPGTLFRDPYALAIGIGLVFSLAGDVWEMLDRRHFLKTLASFLIAHLCYTAAFLADPPAVRFLWAAIPLAFIGAGIFAYLWTSLSAASKPAVALYVAVITVMATLAAGRAVAFPSMGTLSAASGALLFLASDAVLAVNRFRRPFHSAQAVILTSYFAAQLLIALSVGLQVLQ
jgi:uncharacterized membrane protein YhhN